MKVSLERSFKKFSYTFDNLEATEQIILPSGANLKIDISRGLDPTIMSYDTNTQVLKISQVTEDSSTDLTLNIKDMSGKV